MVVDGRSRTTRAFPRWRRRVRVVSLYTCASLGGLLYGYDIGAIGAAIIFIRRQFALDPLSQGVVVSSLLVGAAVGSLFVGPLADRYGRRRVLLAVGVVFLLGTAGSALAADATALIAARLVLGLAVGGSATAVSLYLAETAPTAHRGALSALNVLMITTGLLIAALVGLALARYEAWRWMIGLGVVPALLLVAGMAAQPETPRWLVRSGRIAEARASLARSRPDEAVEPELAEIRSAAATVSSDPRGVRALLSPSIRPLLRIAVCLAVLQPLVGVNIVVNYTPVTMVAAGLGASAALLAGVGVGLANVVFTVVAIATLDRFGRIPLLRVGSVGITLALAGVAVVRLTPGVPSTAANVVTLICLIGYIAFYAMSWGPSVYVMLPELFPSAVRGVGVGFCFVLFWIADLAVTLTFPPLLAHWGAGAVFGIFAGIGVLANVFVNVCLPETGGASLEQLGRRTSITDGPGEH